MFAVTKSVAGRGIKQLIHCTQATPVASSLPSKYILTPSSIQRNFSSTTTNVSLPDPEMILDYDEDVKQMTNEDLTDVTTIPGFTTLIHSMPKNESTPRNALVGKVVSDKMQKTVNVAVDRYRIVPKYRKRMKYTKKFFAHDENEVCATGDLVMIVPCQRISRHKHFMVHEIIRRKGINNEGS